MNTKFDKNNNQNVNANKDMVNHPSHYQSESGLEVIDVIKAFTSNLTGIEATDTGNVLKYMCRWKNKNGVEDLKKAKWYLEHLIDNVENRIDSEEETESDLIRALIDEVGKIIASGMADGIKNCDIDYMTHIFADKKEAERVLSRMNGIIDYYGVVTLADFCYLTSGGIDRTIDGRMYGWINLNDAKIVRTRHGYELRIPVPYRFSVPYTI